MEDSKDSKHMSRMAEKRLTESVHEIKIHGNNKKGRPTRTWNEYVKQEAEKRSINWN